MTGDENITTPKPPADNPRLWLQAAGILAAALALGAIYNSASPLGVRATRSDEMTKPISAPPSPITPTVAATPVVRTGYVNQTVAMNLELATPNRATPAANPSASPTANTPAHGFPKLTWPQVKSLLAANKIVLVDARLKANYDIAHIPGAISFPATSPAAELQAFATKFAKDTAFVLYCGSEQCHMSHSLAESFVKICGYANVSEMPGGMAEYLVANPTPAPDTAR